MMVMRRNSGMISRSSSSRLPLRSAAMNVRPVMLPRGWARLSAKPAETGIATEDVDDRNWQAKLADHGHSRALGHDEIDGQSHQLGG